TCDRTRSAMVESLRRRLISDVPLGVFLSGGIDSSLVCALAVKKLGVTPRTFSIGFENDPQSEHSKAENTATLLETVHSQHVFTAADFDGIGRKIGSLLDEPNGDRSCVPTYLLCKFAREQVIVALSGDGGDELFAGYDRYGYMSDFAGDQPSDFIDRYYRDALPVFGKEATLAAFPGEQTSLESDLDIGLPLFQHPGRHVIHGLRQLDFAYYMTGAVLPKVDRMSMRSSLEVRTPFFSADVCDEAAKLPTGYCWHSKTKMKKLVLRQILGELVGREAGSQQIAGLDTWKKTGFGMPASVFLNNRLAVQDELNTAFESLKGTRFFKERKVALEAMWKKVDQNINSIWAFIVLGQWVRHFPVRL
ncbi:MAG: asparagine synthetase B family protein, partial [Dongiaceae bacterium]